MAVSTFVWVQGPEWGSKRFRRLVARVGLDLGSERDVRRTRSGPINVPAHDDWRIIQTGPQIALHDDEAHLGGTGFASAGIRAENQALVIPDSRKPI